MFAAGHLIREGRIASGAPGREELFWKISADVLRTADHGVKVIGQLPGRHPLQNGEPKQMVPPALQLSVRDRRQDVGKNVKQAGF